MIGVPRAIAEHAETIDADLIVMGAHPPAEPTEDAGIEQSISVSHLSKHPVLVTREQKRVGERRSLT
jgi:nucleotide-binding universal stress UspA family protein